MAQAAMSPVSEGALVQRTFGNAYLGRRARISAAGMGVIQREEDEDETEGEGGKKEGGEKQSSQEPPVQQPPVQQAPLMLTDRPWSEIEKERDPAYQLMFGEDKSGLPKTQIGSMPITLPQPEEEEPEETIQERIERESNTLRLTDRPWREIQGEQRRERQRRKRAEASAKRRAEAPEQGPRPQRTNEVDTFYKQMIARLNTMRGIAASSHYVPELADIEHRQLSRKEGKIYTDSGRNEIDANATALHGKITIRERENVVKLVLMPKKQTTARAVARLKAAISSATDKGVEPFKDYFTTSGEKATIDTNKPRAEALRTRAEARNNQLAQVISDLGNSDQTSPAAASAAESAQDHADDADIGNYATITDPLVEAIGKVQDQGRRRDAKLAYIDAKAVTLHLRDHVRDYVKNKVKFVNERTVADTDALINQQHTSQRNIPKKLWMTDIFGYTQNDRWDPTNPLYLRACKDVEGFKTHMSIFRRTIDADGLTSVAPPANETTIRDAFFKTSSDVMEASHITMEIGGPGDARNPHFYRGGPNGMGRLKTQFGNARWASVKDKLKAEFDAELLRAKNAAKDAIDAGGIDTWPVYK